ncbi:MAG: hypothetical protein M3Q57_00020 [Pseudomonadota bacterium]|nr:hypothetical protein [Pseudomonadota bacterium]
MLGLLALFFATMPIAARRQQRLARGRRPIDAAGFEQAMAARGVTSTTARFLWTDLQAFYHAPLRPMPDDRLESMIAVDRPEIEDLVTRFWGGMRGNDARPPAAPLSNDPNIVELGRHLDLLAGWSIRGSA